MPGILGHGQIRCLEILNGSAHAVPVACAAGLDPGRYEEALAVLGLKGDLKRWYRDQSYSIEIREIPRSRYESYPSAICQVEADRPVPRAGHCLLPEHEPASHSGSLDLQERTGDGSDGTGPRGCAGSARGPGQQPLHGWAKDGNEDPQSNPGRLQGLPVRPQQGSRGRRHKLQRKISGSSTGHEISIAVEDVLVEFFCTRTHIPGKAMLRAGGSSAPDA